MQIAQYKTTGGLVEKPLHAATRERRGVGVQLRAEPQQQAQVVANSKCQMHPQLMAACAALGGAKKPLLNACPPKNVSSVSLRTLLLPAVLLRCRLPSIISETLLQRAVCKPHDRKFGANPVLAAALLEEGGTEEAVPRYFGPEHLCRQASHRSLPSTSHWI